MPVKHTYIVAFGIVDYYTIPKADRVAILVENFADCENVRFLENNPKIKKPKWAAFIAEKLEETTNE
jgi:hypothetical protein